MRILHATDHFPPVLGGIERHVSELARRQARAGHRVTVLTRGPAAVPQVEVDDLVRVVRARSWSASGLRADDIDLCHSHLSVVAPFTAPVASLLARAGVPSLTTVHSMWGGMGPLPGMAAAVCGLAGAPLTWTAVSAAAAGTVRRQIAWIGAPASPLVQVLPNAVDLSPRLRTRLLADPAAGSGPVRLISTMRLARRKRPLPMADVLGRVVAACTREVSLTVVGDGPLREKLVADLRRRGLRDHVRFTGQLPSAQVERELTDADVYVAPARLESFGLAALEARSVGLPVVGYASGGLTEYVRHGVEGLLVADDAGLVAQLCRVVDDADLLVAMSEHNRLVPSGFGWAGSLQRHDRLYSTLVARDPRTLRGSRPLAVAPISGRT